MTALILLVSLLPQPSTVEPSDFKSDRNIDITTINRERVSMRYIEELGLWWAYQGGQDWYADEYEFCGFSFVGKFRVWPPVEDHRTIP